MNKRNFENGFLLLLIMLIISCSPAKSQTRRDKNEKTYEEDISITRPKYEAIPEPQQGVEQNKVEGLPEKSVTETLNNKLDTLAKNEGPIRYQNGYRILVYSGKNREEIQKVRIKLNEIIPDINIYQTVRSPNQLVKAGDCLDQREAYYLLGKLKKDFPNAVMIPDEVVVR
jgi:hypothetical protein